MWNDLIHLDKGPLKILGETKKLFTQAEKNQLDEFKLIEIFAMVGKSKNPNSSKLPLDINHNSIGSAPSPDTF